MKIGAFLLLVLWAIPAWSQNVPTADTGNGETTDGIFGDSSQPIDISAEAGLEYRQKERVYIARGNAKAVRGKGTVEGDTLTAYYSDNGKELVRFVAQGNARLANGNTVMTGALGDYDAVKKVVHMTGGQLAVQSSDETITATEYIDYWTDRRILTAKGDTKVVQKNTTIKADQTTIYLHRDGPNKGDAYQIESSGHVMVTTSKQQATANKLVRHIDKEITLLIGNVVIVEGDRRVEGDKAEIDDKSGVSRLLGPGRVKVNLTPKTSKVEQPAQ